MNHEIFKDFISKSNIYSTIIAILTTSQILVLINGLFDYLISPIINSILKRDKNTKLKDYIVTIHDTDFEVGQFILVAIKFIAVLICIYLFITSDNIKINKS